MKRILSTLKEKWPEYLLEILVLIIGIYGAFALDKWNENAKSKRTEFELLKALHHDLGENILQLNSVIAFDSMVYSRQNVLVKILDSEASVYHDTLKIYFGFSNRSASFDPQRLAYESLKSIGFDIISDIQVRNKVIELYDQDYSHFKETGESQGRMYVESSKIFFRHLRGGESPLEKIPNDFESLKKNDEFKNLISTLASDQKYVIQFHKNILKATIDTYELLATQIE